MFFPQKPKLVFLSPVIVLLVKVIWFFIGQKTIQENTLWIILSILFITLVIFFYLVMLYFGFVKFGMKVKNKPLVFTSSILIFFILVLNLAEILKLFLVFEIEEPISLLLSGIMLFIGLLFSINLFVAAKGKVNNSLLIPTVLFCVFSGGPIIVIGSVGPILLFVNVIKSVLLSLLLLNIRY